MINKEVQRGTRDFLPDLMEDYNNSVGWVTIARFDLGFFFFFLLCSNVRAIGVALVVAS